MIFLSLLRSRAGIYLRIKRTYQLSCYTRVHYSSRDLERMTASLDTLKFDNRTIRSLPLDKEKDNYVRTVSGNGGRVFFSILFLFVLGACYSLVKPTPLINPSLVAVSIPALNLLGLTADEVIYTSLIKLM